MRSRTFAGDPAIQHSHERFSRGPLEPTARRAPRREAAQAHRRERGSSARQEVVAGVIGTCGSRAGSPGGSSARQEVVAGVIGDGDATTRAGPPLQRTSRSGGWSDPIFDARILPAIRLQRTSRSGGWSDAWSQRMVGRHLRLQRTSRSGGWSDDQDSLDAWVESKHTSRGGGWSDCGASLSVTCGRCSSTRREVVAGVGRAGSSDTTTPDRSSAPRGGGWSGSSVGDGPVARNGAPAHVERR